MIGFASFGGGYAMIPVIEVEVVKHGWMSTQQFTDIIAVAGMSPGPIATNSAIIVGYKTAGLAGATASAVGMTLPSLLIILLVASFFYKFNQTKLVKSAFYGLRPIITGLIIYAAIRFAISNQVIGTMSWQTLSLMLIFAVSLLALRKRMHPILVIALSGLAGIVCFA